MTREFNNRDAQIAMNKKQHTLEHETVMMKISGINSA
jgi:hypothetical protein